MTDLARPRRSSGRERTVDVDGVAVRDHLAPWLLTDDPDSNLPNLLDAARRLKQAPADDRLLAPGVRERDVLGWSVDRLADRRRGALIEALEPRPPPRSTDEHRKAAAAFFASDLWQGTAVGQRLSMHLLAQPWQPTACTPRDLSVFAPFERLTFDEAIVLGRAAQRAVHGPLVAFVDDAFVALTGLSMHAGTAALGPGGIMGVPDHDARLAWLDRLMAERPALDDRRALMDAGLSVLQACLWTDHPFGGASANAPAWGERLSQRLRAWVDQGVYPTFDAVAIERMLTFERHQWKDPSEVGVKTLLQSLVAQRQAHELNVGTTRTEPGRTSPKTRL